MCSTIISTDAGRFYDVVGGKQFSFIGGRSKPNRSDTLKATLLMDTAILKKFIKLDSSKPIAFADEHPPPPNWQGVQMDAADWGGHGKSCQYYDNCEYWGSSLFLMGGEWTCANCRIDRQLQGISETKNINSNDVYKLSTLDTEDVTFEAIQEWSDAKILNRSEAYVEVIKKLISDDKPVYVPSVDDAPESIVLKPKIEKKLSRVKDVGFTFKAFKDLKLPMDPENIRGLFRKFDSEYNLRAASSSPLLCKADTSEVHSALMKLADRTLQHQLDCLYPWVTERYGNSDTIMGLHIIKTALVLASRSTEVMEEGAIYIFFATQRQPKVSRLS